MNRPHLAVLLAIAVALVGCQQTPDSTGAGTTAQGTTARGSPGSATAGGAAPASRSDRMRRAWNLLGQWDAAQSAGQKQISQRLEGELRQLVDGGFQEFEQASAGSQGAELQYLSTSVLGFSGNPAATQVIERRLDDRDANLIANALVALAIRKDPATKLSPVMTFADTRAPELPRRYAPLVLGTVVDARARSGQPRDPRLEAEIFRRVSTLASDRDVYTRLHVAKALGAVQNAGKTDYLLGLVRDPQMRVRWAAAAALERSGDVRGFPEAVRLMHEVPEAQKHIIQDIVVSYAGRIRKRPMTEQEVTELGTSAAQWSRWFAKYQRDTGVRVPPSRS